MPGSVQNAAPATVLPASLCRSFVHQRAYPLVENEYKNGESQRVVLGTTSRKRWRLGKRLAPAQLQTLRNFWEARNGPLEAFYFYDPYETNPKFSWDGTGATVTGRYIVRFNGDWQDSIGQGRSDVQIELVEVG